MEKLIEWMQGHSKLDQNEIDLLHSHWNRSNKYKRQQFLIQPGQLEHFIHFVEEGTFRIFYPYQDQEICVGFAYPQTILCAYPSLIRSLPSKYYIQCLRASSLLSISWSDYQLLMQSSETFKNLWLKLTEEALLGKIEREAEMLTFSPAERLERLQKRSPHIFQLIPRKYIASYLRMSPETLSRILSNS